MDEYFFCRLARTSPQTNYLAVRAGARAGAPAYMYYTIHVAVGTLFFKKSLSLLQNIFFLRFHDSQTGAGQPVIKISREAGWRAPGHASPQTRYQIMWDVVAKSFQNKLLVDKFKVAKIARQPPQSDVPSVGWRALVRASPHGEVVHLRAGVRQSAKEIFVELT